MICITKHTNIFQYSSWGVTVPGGLDQGGLFVHSGNTMRWVSFSAFGTCLGDVPGKSQKSHRCFEPDGLKSVALLMKQGSQMRKGKGK